MRQFRMKLFPLLVVFSLGFALWGCNSPQAGPSAQRAMQSNHVEITQGNGITFSPKEETKTGFIFYQGARIRPESYAVEMASIAEAGYLVVIPQMPFDLAIFGSNKADMIIKSHPEIEHWAIGGHSLGGVMAAKYTYEHPNAVEALILWASYPAKSNNLSAWGGAATSISASLDGLSTPAKIRASKTLLPPTTNYIVINGGNHAQFGDYGEQSGDNPAIIPKEQQWSEIVNATIRTLTELE